MCKNFLFLLHALWTQDSNPIKYSIGEAISKQVQTVFMFGWCLIATMYEKTEGVCVHASADYKFLRTNNLKTRYLCLFVQPLLYIFLVT